MSVIDKLDNKVKVLYISKDRRTISNSNTETSVLSNTITLPKNSLKVGDIINITLYGRLTTSSTAPTTTIKVKAGSTSLINNSTTVTASLNAGLAKLDIKILVKAIGTNGVFILEGLTFAKDIANFSAGAFRALAGSDVTIDTTKDIVLDATYKFNTASASNVFVTEIVEILFIRE